MLVVVNRYGTGPFGDHGFAGQAEVDPLSVQQLFKTNTHVANGGGTVVELVSVAMKDGHIWDTDVEGRRAILAGMDKARREEFFSRD